MVLACINCINKYNITDNRYNVNIFRIYFCDKLCC